MSPQSAPYGSWKSPITSDLIVSESISITGDTFNSEGARNLQVSVLRDIAASTNPSAIP